MYNIEIYYKRAMHIIHSVIALYQYTNGYICLDQSDTILTFRLQLDAFVFRL